MDAKPQSNDESKETLRVAIENATKEVREARKTLAIKLQTLDLLLQKAGVVA